MEHSSTTALDAMGMEPDETSSAPVLTEEHVRAVFSYWEDGQPALFAAHVAEDVEWTQMGTHPLARCYTSKHAYFEAADGPIARIVKAIRGRLRLRVQSVLIAGSWATVELHAQATAKGGWAFDNNYCWLLEFRQGLIQTVRSYIADASQVTQLIEESES